MNMTDIFQQKLKAGRINVLIKRDVFFPHKIKVMYLDWEFYRMIIITVFGGMLSISNHKSEIEIRLSVDL